MTVDDLDIYEYQDDPKSFIKDKEADIIDDDSAYEPIWKDWKYLKAVIKKGDRTDSAEHIKQARTALLNHGVDRDDLAEPTYQDFSDSIGNLDVDRDYFADHVHETTVKTVPDKSSNLSVPNHDNGTYYPAKVLVKQTYTGDPKKLDEFYKELVDMATFGDYAVAKARQDGTYWDGVNSTYDPDSLADLKHATYTSVLSMANAQILDEADNYNYDHDTNVATN